MQRSPFSRWSFRMRWSRSPAGPLAAALACAALAAAGCGGTPSGPPDQPAATPPAGIETVAPEKLRAGDAIHATCSLLDAHGTVLGPAAEGSYTLQYAPASAVMKNDAGDMIVTRAGSLAVTCVLGMPTLFDETPAIVAIDPGPVAQLATHLDHDIIDAGGAVAATCEAYDAWGNAIAPSMIGATLRADPDLADNTLAGLSATLTRAGAYQLFCEVTGATTTGARLDARPGLPASIVVSRVPDRAVYGQGEVVEIASLVADRYGNQVPAAQVAVVSAPAGVSMGESRFRYFTDARYHLTATVQGETDGG